jgi:hypothetical protein
MKIVSAAAALCLMLSGCSHADQASVAALAAAPSATTAAESNAANAAGDIPDTQAFVRYAGAGFSVLVPEGWSRVQRGSVVTFSANANSESVDTAPAPDTTAELRARFGATGPITFRRVTIGGAPVTVASFASRSQANAVTGKTTRLESAGYVFERRGRRAVLVLSAPAGADNADQWKKISESFRWK